jgi:hypothetical protein
MEKIVLIVMVIALILMGIGSCDQHVSTPTIHPQPKREGGIDAQESALAVNRFDSSDRMRAGVLARQP